MVSEMARLERGSARVERLGRERASVGKWVLTAVVLGWFALMILGPAAALLSRALSGGWGRFVQSVTSPQALSAFQLTLSVTAVATVVNTLAGIVLAILLVRGRFPGKTILDGLVDLPFAVSPIIAGLMLVLLYGPGTWVGSRLEAHGIHVVYGYAGMVLACLFVTLPFVVREIMPVLREYGVDQEEVAYTLGASSWVTFWRVTLPSIRWGLAYGVALTIARSLGEFGALLVLSGNILGRTQTATLYVHDQIESFTPEGAYAASVVLAGISFTLLYGMEAVRKVISDRESRGDS